MKNKSTSKLKDVSYTIICSRSKLNLQSTFCFQSRSFHRWIVRIQKVEVLQLECLERIYFSSMIKNRCTLHRSSTQCTIVVDWPDSPHSNHLPIRHSKGWKGEPWMARLEASISLSTYRVIGHLSPRKFNLLRWANRPLLSGPYPKRNQPSYHSYCQVKTNTSTNRVTACRWLPRLRMPWWLVGRTQICRTWYRSRRTSDDRKESKDINHGRVQRRCTTWGSPKEGESPLDKR